MFTHEDVKHLSYLGSMLQRPHTQFEEEVQTILDAGSHSKEEGPAEQGKTLQSEGAD